LSPQLASSVQVLRQPVEVQISPGPQLELPEHAFGAGAATSEQPYASHV
jgi:hypothetical protein